jgi:Tfp pilus assembly protein PilP
MVVRSVGIVIAMALVMVLAGCNEDSVGGTTTEEFAAQRDKLKQALAKKKGPQRPSGPNAGQTGEADPEAGYASAGTNYVYDSGGKRDPFRSFQFVDEEVPKQGFGPLGDFELGQLSVVAVVWDTSKPRALVADPGGRSFVVHEGSQIGKNNGRVIHIGDNLVLVKETYVDFEGNETTKDVELRIRRSQGG